VLLIGKVGRERQVRFFLHCLQRSAGTRCQSGFFVFPINKLNQDGVVIRVVDDGAGIPEELRTRLFNPFVSSKESGTGLGLWVSRSIVEKHGGSIRLEGSTSKSRSGTTVAIFLPLRAISRKNDSAEDAPDVQQRSA
jgi:signal transduction histidine kinase